jgi:hypothetical protein
MELLWNGRPVKQQIAYFSKLIIYSLPWKSEESPASLTISLFAMPLATHY